MTIRAIHILLLLFGTWSLVTSESGTGQHDFHKAFMDFMYINDFRGGAVAAMTGGHLVFADGFGTDHRGAKVKASTKFHMSSLAKSLTAVVTLQLAQTGQLSLDDKVFGPTGLLADAQPWHQSGEDARLYDITVEHLLTDRAGWDSSKGPLLDPLFNKHYMRRKGQHKVPDIAAKMGLEWPPTREQLLSYLMAMPLDFKPGERVAYSNTGYFVLGRVIEAVTQRSYHQAVERYILAPCGMWNTVQKPDLPRRHKAGLWHNAEPATYRDLDLDLIDSSLGWYSTAYDIIRFARCVFDSHKLLDIQHKNHLLAPPSGLAHNQSWITAGFRANSDGVVWQEADPHTDSLILYHDPRPGSSPNTWVILLAGTGLRHLRHSGRELMSHLDNIQPTQNLFLADLSQVHTHSMWKAADRPYDPKSEITIHYRVKEQHVSAYVDALQDEGFTVRWFTSYNHYGHTYFLLLGARIVKPVKAQYDFIFRHGLDPRRLLLTKLQLEQHGYNMTQLHSYVSLSHSMPTSFAALFRRDAFSQQVQMKYGTSHLPEPYHKLVQMYHEQQFFPLSQTVVYHDKDEEFSFVFIKDLTKDRIEFKHFYDLSPTQLSNLTSENSKHGLHMTYLNSYKVRGKYRLSAVFNNATASPGILETDQLPGRAIEVTISNLEYGLSPQFIVPYLDKKHKLKLAIYFQEM